MKILDQVISRVSPRQVHDCYTLPLGWIVIRYDHLETKGDRRKTHGRWVKIGSGKGSVYRLIRYSGSLPRDGIVIDYLGWMELQGREDEIQESYPITISSVRWYENFILPFKHIDPGIRLSSYLGGLSIILGVISVLK